jgi:CHAT domain-containing protein
MLGCVPTFGGSATRERLLTALESSDWLVYTGHGDFEERDGLKSGLRLANGVRVTAEDVFALSRTPELVVLSACVSGVSERRAGDELVGLVRALLLKGTDTVIASHWQVPDAATGVLFSEFFRGLTGGARPVDALRRAAGEVGGRPGWRHAYYWGGFVVYGRG